MAARTSAITQRSLNALETKNKLYNTALMLFTKKGFDKVTVDDITRYAGVSKGTFYNHFSTKEQVLVEQFNKIDNHYEQALRRSNPGETASQRLLHFSDAMCEYCGEVWGLNMLKVVYTNQISLGKHPDILLRRDRLFYSLLADIIKQGRENGEFRTDMSAEDQLYLFARSARSALYEWCLHDAAFDLKESARLIFKLALDNVLAGKRD